MDMFIQQHWPGFGHAVDISVKDGDSCGLGGHDAMSEKVVTACRGARIPPNYHQIKSQSATASLALSPASMAVACLQLHLSPCFQANFDLDSD